MKKIRVCQLITELRPAGAELCVYELATRLDPSIFEVLVVALRGGAMADRLIKAGVPVTILNVSSRFDFPALFKLAGILRKFNPDILHTHLFHADLAGRLGAYLTSVPHLVNTVHVAEGRFRPWHFAFSRIFSQKCKCIVCPSKSVRDFHHKKAGMPLDYYRIILNGVDVKSYSHDPRSRTKYRSEWNIAPDTPVVGFIGRLEHQKGLDTMLSAMSHLAARGEAINLVIAGDGPQRSILENFIKHGEGGKHTRYLGFTEDVRGVLSAIDILAMPSRWEGFGLVAGEAMAAGLAVVSTDVPGLCDVVVNEQTGLVVEKDNPLQLAEQIQRLAQDPQLRNRLGQAGRQRVAKEFSIQSTIEKHRELYIELAQNRDKPSIKPNYINWNS